MQGLHERLLLAAGLLYVVSLGLYYAAFIALFPALLCLLVSLPCGMTYMRHAFPNGTVSWRNHCSYGLVALFWACALALLVGEICFPGVETTPLYLAVVLLLLAALYLIPFALVPWRDGRRWLPRRRAWGLLLGALLLVYSVWVLTPDALPGAAAAGRWLSVRLLLALGHEVQYRDVFGRTALFRAAVAGHPAVVALLLAHGADVNPRDNGGSTPLDVLAHAGHLPMLQLLHAAGAPLDGSRGVLRQAAAAQHDAMVEWLLAQQVTVAGSGALEAAAAYANAAMVRRLLQHTPTPDRSTGLAESAARGDRESVQLFLAHGAEVNQPDAHGMAPLIRAVRHGRHQVPEATILALLDLLLAAGADLAFRDQGGNTALILAVEDQHATLVAHLLARGAPVDLANDLGWTALWRAVAHGNEAMVRTLLAAGASACTDEANALPFIQEARERAPTSIQALLQQACQR